MQCYESKTPVCSPDPIHPEVAMIISYMTDHVHETGKSLLSIAELWVCIPDIPVVWLKTRFEWSDDSFYTYVYRKPRTLSYGWSFNMICYLKRVNLKK